MDSVWIVGKQEVMPAAVTGQSYLFCERGVVPFSRAYTHTPVWFDRLFRVTYT